MAWKLYLSKDAEKFLDKNQVTTEKAKDLVRKSLRYFEGEDINIDIKKLRGEWKGFYRIRSGKLRILAEFDFEHSTAFVEQIDWRGSAYK